ncbi:MAG: MarR family transcriptional regulator [Actinomycetota bacterium]
MLTLMRVNPPISRAASTRNLVDEVILAWRDVGHGLQFAGPPMLLGLDLTMAQLKALIVIAHHGPAPIGRVAEHLQVGMPTASHLVDRLVQAGLIERTEDPSDRRRAIVKLSAEGGSLVAGLREQGREHLRPWLSRLDPLDLDALLRGLKAFAGVLRTPSATGTARHTSASSSPAREAARHKTALPVVTSGADKKPREPETNHRRRATGR